MLLMPAVTPVARPGLAMPFDSIVAMVVADDCQAAADVTLAVLLSEYFAVAVNCTVVPAAIVVVGAEMVRLTSVADETSRPAVPVMPMYAAVMVDVPAATGVASPVIAPIVAVAVELDDHVAVVVTSEFVPSLKFACALNWTVAPPT
jgi:hypothetical protein